MPLVAHEGAQELSAILVAMLQIGAPVLRRVDNRWLRNARNPRPFDNGGGRAIDGSLLIGLGRSARLGSDALLVLF